MNLFNPVGSVAFCIFFFNNTEQEPSEFFDKSYLKEKYRFSIDRNWTWGIAAKRCLRFLVSSNHDLVFLLGNVISAQKRVHYNLVVLNYLVIKWKERKITFNQSDKRSKYGLIIEGLFEVLGEMWDKNFLYVFLNERRSKIIVFKISYRKRNREKNWICFFWWGTSYKDIFIKWNFWLILNSRRFWCIIIITFRQLTFDSSL